MEKQSDDSVQSITQNNQQHQATQAHENKWKITVYDRKGNQLAQMEDQKAIEKILRILASKKITLIKMLPLFETKLVIQNAAETTEWWIASGYIKNASQADAPLMVIDSDTDLVSLVKSLSQ